MLGFNQQLKITSCMMLVLTVWSSAVRCFLIVFLLKKGKGRGGGLAREAGREEGDACQKSEGPLLPCLDTALAAQ